MKWLDKIIEEQKCNTDILEKVCSPNTPAELAEIAYMEAFEEF